MHAELTARKLASLVGQLMNYLNPNNWDSQSWPHLCLLFTATLLRPAAEVGRGSLLAAPSVKAGVGPGAGKAACAICPSFPVWPAPETPAANPA